MSGALRNNNNNGHGGGGRIRIEISEALALIDRLAASDLRRFIVFAHGELRSRAASLQPSRAEPAAAKKKTNKQTTRKTRTAAGA